MYIWHKVCQLAAPASTIQMNLFFGAEASIIPTISAPFSFEFGCVLGAVCIHCIHRWHDVKSRRSDCGSKIAVVRSRQLNASGAAPNDCVIFIAMAFTWQIINHISTQQCNCSQQC